MNIGYAFRRPAAKRAALAGGVLVLLVGLAGFLVAPHYLRPYLEQILTDKLHRSVSIGELSINPYALSVSVKRFAMKEADGSGDAVRFDELYVNVEAESIFRASPVVSALRVERPWFHLVRTAGNRYNFTDLVEEFLNKPDTEPKAHYALHNIQVSGGRIEFDDRPTGHRHVVSDLDLGIPFLSNLPSKLDVYVQPALSAKVNGAPFAVHGKARPFSDTREATVAINLKDVDLAGYFDYVPVPPGFKLPAGRLDTELVVAFSQPRDKPMGLDVSGSAALRQVETVDRNGQPLLKFGALRVAVHSYDVLRGKLALDSLHLDAPEATVRRLRNGHLNLEALAPASSQTGSAPSHATAQAAKQDGAFHFSIGELKLTDGKLAITDEVPAKPFHTEVEGLNLSLKKFGNQGGAPGAMEIALRTSSGEELKEHGTIGLTPLAVQGEVKLSHVRPGNYAAYLAPFVNLAVEDGKLDASGKFAVSLAGDKLQASGSAFKLALEGLRLAQPGEMTPLFTLASLEASGGEFDLAKRSATLEELKTSAGKLLLERDKDGKLNLEKLLPDAPAAVPSARVRQAAKPEAPWVVTLKKLAVEGYGVRLEDRAARRGIPLVLEPIALTADNLSTRKGMRSNVDFKAGINRKGSASIVGTVALAPLQAALKLNVNGLELVPLQPFFGDRLNVLVTRGALSAKGSLDYAAAPNGAGPGKAAFKGDLGVANLGVIDRGNSADLLKWKSLAVAGVNAAVDGGPFRLEVADVALADFFASLVVNPDGTLALQKLVRTPDAAATGGAKAGATVVAPAPAGPLASAPANRIRVDKVRFQRGAVNFSDYFIKPNYSASLADINGSITGLSSEAGTTAGVELKGKVDGYAPVEVVGKVNPLAKEVYLDLKAEAKGMELSGLTPYAERYAGYAIDKGKLSMDIRYSIENRLLKAENHLFLDQLTFGQRVESPEATKLPVLLAVALLKNGRGEIDVNLPIGGSLDDPQFSVGGIIFQVVMNLLAKAVTSPFALLGSVFGGSDEELGYLEYAPGHAAIAKPGEDKLAKLASALKDRPGLKLEIAGRADPSADLEGLKRVELERKVKAQKLRETVRQGSDGGSVDEVQVSAQEWPKYLEAAYKREKFDKPRNAIGLARSLPPAEMEKLMLANIQVSEDELRSLADRRAKAVREWLGTNGVADERLFIIGSHLGQEDTPAGVASTAALSRTEFSLK